MTERKALKLALEALEDLMYWDNGKPEFHEASKRIIAIKEHLAQPEQEPVEYQIKILGERWTHCAKHIYDPNNPNTRALYTTPPQRTWVGLTDDDIFQMGLSNYIQVIREAEAKLKEKNT